MTTAQKIRSILSTLALILLPVMVSAQTYTLAPPPYQTVLDNSGEIVNNACVWTYAAGTTTPVATYLDNMGTSNSNPIRSDSAGRFTVFLQAGVGYKFVYENPCTPPAHGSVLRTADNISGVPSSSATTDVTGTAGETLSAGMAVYLSAGDGGKTAGQWYKADSANAYSSTTNVVGVAPAAIPVSTAGTIRLSGSVSGLSSLTLGATYYVGTAGALTLTPPVNKRIVGQADTSTSLLAVSDPPIVPITAPVVTTSLACGRLTLTTATPVTITDVTAATTVYYTPVTGCNQITLYNGTVNITDTLTEISLAVPATTATLYDVFVYDNAGTPALEFLAWTNDTTRATAITIQNGYYAKAATPTRRYVGSFRTTGSSGQTEDSVLKRFVWNFYNRVHRPLVVREATATWTYSTATYHQVNASAADQVDVVVGVADQPVLLWAIAFATNSSGSATHCYTSIGYDVTNALTTGVIVTGATALSTDGASANPSAVLVHYPAVGHHYYAWLEASDANATTTWAGTGGGTLLQTGMSGFIEG